MSTETPTETSILAAWSEYQEAKNNWDDWFDPICIRIFNLCKANQYHAWNGYHMGDASIDLSTNRVEIEVSDNQCDPDGSIWCPIAWLTMTDTEILPEIQRLKAEETAALEARKAAAKAALDAKEVANRKALFLTLKAEFEGGK